MTLPLPVRLVQFDPLVGDVDGNAARMQEYWKDAPEALWVFPELAVCGYPPEDLLLRADFLDCVEEACARIVAASGAHWVLFGAPLREGTFLYNAAFLAHGGRLHATARKRCLPHYDVFDEQRYFTPGEEASVVSVAGFPVGILICEDLWDPGLSAELVAGGAQVLACLNASPFDAAKATRRRQEACARASETGCAVWYVNQVGGQDELVFDGASFVIDAEGSLRAQAPSFRESMLRSDDVGDFDGPTGVDLEPDEALYQALVLAVRDYVDKHRFPGVVVGISGGIDSALVLVLAVDALGAARCRAVRMPSRYTSDASNEDAEELCARLGVHISTLSIEPVFDALCTSLASIGVGGDLVEQNLQARIRGTLLMAQSNHGGDLLLTTGNKSELAVGYATLYGDMAGGFAPLKDVFKTRVYDLARLRNRRQPVIPERILTRAPTAELRPDQKDTDTLPGYPVLDAILKAFIEEDRPVSEIVAQGFDPEVVRTVVSFVFASEHKRRQAPPGAKVTERAFGRDRRYPVTSGYKA